MKKIFLFLSILTIFTTGLFAQKSQLKRFALVIGNQDYQENALSNPRADARLMERALKDCGFDVTLKYDLSYTEMADVFADFATKVDENGSKDTITFIYYSGHGVQINGKNYMVPTDNKNIVDEIKAKSRCKAIDDLIELVPSETQIVVLDACRNNPFRETKTKFTKGLTRIAAPRHVPNFLTLFSTGDGQTADDGAGRNSLFTEILSTKIRTEMNTQVLVLFNDVADEVKTRTSGKQIPLIAGTSVNIELMNAEIAAAKQAEIQSQLKQIKKDLSTTDATTYETEKNLLNAELQIMKDRELAAKQDKREKEEKQRKDNQVKAQNQREMERIQKEVEHQKKALQKQKAEQKSATRYVTEIEENKQKVQELRKQIANKINYANNDVQFEADAKIDEINNRPLGLTETDSNGKITKAAKSKREAEKSEIMEKAAADKRKNKEIYYATIKDEESQRMNQIENDLKTIKTATYTASSINNEVVFDVSNYDGAACRWIIKFKSNLFNDNSLFASSIDFTYEQLCKIILKQKYVVPTKMNDAQNDSYLDVITQYDELIRGDSILYVEVDYKIEPIENVSSQYKISTSNASLYCFTSENEPILITSQKFESTSVLKWNPRTVLRSVDDMISESVPKKATKKVNVQTKKNYSNQGQQTLSGLALDLTAVTDLGVELGYYYPVNNNVFVRPFVGSRELHMEYEKVTYPVSAVLGGIEGGVSYSVQMNRGVLDPYLSAGVFVLQPTNYIKESYFGLQGSVGLAYIHNRIWGFNVDIGFNTVGENPGLFRLGFFITHDLLTGNRKRY